MKTRQLVPLTFVADVERSIDFYKHLGFEVAHTFATEGAKKPTWAWLRSGDAQSMLGETSEKAIASDQQRTLFYLYTDDVATAHATLKTAGFNPSEITTPFYAPRGEFKVTDPDSHVLMITHT